MSVAELSPERQARRTTPVALTAFAIHVPGRSWDRIGLRADDEQVVPADRAHELLGRKGLLAKDEATRLALCAVHRALGSAPRAPKPNGPADPDTAVIACSNLGNVETVVRVARTARSETARAVSALDAPNASSNVIASTVAIWWRCGGPNLMVCSGATAGLDAVALGSLLLRSGRSERVIVVGAEPGDPVACSIGSHRAGGRSLQPGAAAVILALGGRDTPAAELGEVDFVAPGPAPPPPDNGRIVLGPAGILALEREVIDLREELGDLYGANGVVAVAAAGLLGEQTGEAVGIVCGDSQDGWRTTTLSAPGASTRGG